MAKIITGVENYDSRRNKVTLDYGEVTFLLYKKETASLGIRQGEEISDEKYLGIRNDILLKRAEKKALYYMKSSDRTENEIRKKLKEGLYPEDIAEDAIAWLRSHGFVDDERYAEDYISSLSGRHSRREIEAKLYKKGLSGSEVKDLLKEKVTDEDEYAACESILHKRYPSGVPAGEKQKAYGFLMRKGFSYDAAEHALNAAAIDR